MGTAQKTAMVKVGCLKKHTRSQNLIAILSKTTGKVFIKQKQLILTRLMWQMF